MAKRVTTPARLNSAGENKKEKGVNVGLIFILAILTVAIFVAVAYFIVRATNEQAAARRKLEEQSRQADAQPQQEVLPKEPVNIQLSGSGQSSSEQFELGRGSYIVNYSFSDNIENYGSFSSDTNFISEIKCSDGYSLSIANKISGVGSGSEYLNIDTIKKCFYSVKDASPSAKWSLGISDN